MAHILTTYDAEGHELSAVKTNDRQRAFDLYDALTRGGNLPTGGLVTLTGDGIDKRFRAFDPDADMFEAAKEDFARTLAEDDDEARAETKEASRGAGERAGGAPDDSGHAAPAPQAAPPAKVEPQHAKPKSGKAKSGALTSH